MLKMTGVNDPDKCMFFEQGMRGGVSYINKRYSETSKKNTFFIFTWITYMDVLWGNIYLLVILSRSKTLIKSNKN